jgi:hypothetical protein
MAKKNKIKKRANRPDLADALVKVAKAQADLQVQPDDLLGRRRNADAVRGPQAEYLRQVSPAAADAWERTRAA